jgi:hypothetical protein
MTYKWLEDAFNAFQQETGEIHFESLTQMMLAIEYWAEEHGLELGEARRRAKVLKQMFDGADNLVKEGFDPPQVVMILQNRLALACDCEEGPGVLTEAVHGVEYEEPEDSEA